MGGLWLMYFAGGCVVLALLSLRGGGTSQAARPVSAGAPPLRTVPPDVEAKARELMARGQTITAIKIVREASGMGLKEAKDWVEAVPGRPPTAAAPSPSEGADSPSERLAELKRMLDAGLITNSDYEAK
ncbi:MAG: ribosomal protein L7/L12, partial [Gemmatimonadetes bacterium]|nr:ribosomal protein L7/L12 [Gemmatimonadota bacterium]